MLPKESSFKAFHDRTSRYRQAVWVEEVLADLPALFRSRCACCHSLFASLLWTPLVAKTSTQSQD